MYDFDGNFDWKIYKFWRKNWCIDGNFNGSYIQKKITGQYGFFDRSAIIFDGNILTRLIFRQNSQWQKFWQIDSPSYHFLTEILTEKLVHQNLKDLLVVLVEALLLINSRKILMNFHQNFVTMKFFTIKLLANKAYKCIRKIQTCI